MNDLEELKSLLIGAEKQALESITERVETPETRAVDVADVLPAAVRISHQEGNELVSTLREPVGECLRESFHEAPQHYADALYPVMGPAIRKSIIETLRAFVQQVNDTVEQSLSAKGVKWRYEAWRAGVPFGDYVIQKTLLYRIEQTYLISRENGLLISHVHHNASRIKDSDAVSAMFTAIQDFVKESFSPDRTGRLETADMGEFTLWAVHGPHALLVCVIRGVPPRSLRGDLSAILERIHFRYGESIRLYSGDTSSMPDVDEELQHCLQLEAQQPAAKDKRRLSTQLMVVLIGLAALLGYLALDTWQNRQQLQRLRQVLYNTPGLYVAALERDGTSITVRGLRDPLAATIPDIATAAGIDASQIVADLGRYQSLDPEIVFLRTRSSLNIPASVSASEQNQTLLLSGTAPQAWIDSVRQKSASGALALPVDFSGVESQELLQLHTDLESAGEASFYFSSDASLPASDTENLRRHAARIRQLLDTAQPLGIALDISIIGYTDSTGTQAFNTTLAELRAATVRQIILEQDIDPDRISTSSRIPSVEFGDIDLGMRRVSVLLTPAAAGVQDAAATE